MIGFRIAVVILNPVIHSNGITMRDRGGRSGSAAKVELIHGLTTETALGAHSFDPMSRIGDIGASEMK